MTSIVVRGSHFVGVAPVKTFRGQPRKDNRPVDVFEDEDHLMWQLSETQRGEALSKEKHHNLRAYIKHYALQRRQEIANHSLRPCWNPCYTCGNCECARTWPGEWARCVCGSGTKMLSPYRRVFMNNSAKWHRLNHVYNIDTQSCAPRSAEFYAQHARGLD